MSDEEPGDDPTRGLDPPPGARVHDLEVGGEALLVISYRIEHADQPRHSVLSTAEREVARLAIDGMSNARIAERRSTSLRTVANQMASIFKKLGVGSRRELAARYFGDLRWQRR
jgi:DNA-binding CsgD family transcriptional regulator